MSTGWDLRLGILRRDAEEKLLEPLRQHSWTCKIDREVEHGEYLIVSAERGGHRHAIALLYSSATSNAVYKSLSHQVEHIFTNGELYQLESFAYGINTPVSRVVDFHALLLEWNAASSNGKFAPADDDAVPIIVNRPEHRVLLSEEPIQAIWLRIRQLQSVTLATKLIAGRAQRENVDLANETIRSKAEGVAFALRNASDYFQSPDVHNVSQRVLNIYYGSMAFAFAEMLAAPTGPETLAVIEENTKQGHGLYTIDGSRDGLEQLVVGMISAGFFPAWVKSMGVTLGHIPERKPRQYGDLDQLPTASWLTLEQLFASIPEVADLFNDIFDGAPRWVNPTYDQDANGHRMTFVGDRPKAVTRAYAQLIDSSARLTKEDIAAFPGPISEIREVPSEGYGRHFRIAVDYDGKDTWWHALKVHHSPFQRQALILPIFGIVDEYRAICMVLLYALSIVVRYRPSIWRRVQGGDLDHMRVLIEAFLVVAERVLPEQFLEKITAERVFAQQPGSWF